MKKEFNNQFATQKLRTEMSTTTGPVPGSATITPPGGSTDFYTTKKKKKKVEEDQEDVEPKLAAGEAENYVKDHWGWTEAPSKPNRKDKGISYIKVFEGEELSESLDSDITNAKNRLKDPHTITNILYKKTDGGDKYIQINYKYDYVPGKMIDPNGQFVSIFYNTDSDLEKIAKELEIKLKQSVNENYSRFKKETKTRTNEQQLHAAMRLAEKKIYEANRILEYTTQLRTELNETRVNKNTQRLMEKITKGIAEAYGKMKKLK